MKKLFSTFVALMLLIGTINAASVAVTATGGATPTSLLSTGGLVSQVVIANSTASTMAFKLFNSPSAAVTYTNAAYTTRSSAIVSLTNVVVTITGVTNTTIYPALSTSTVVTSGSTNDYQTLATITVPASGTATWTPVVPVNATLGLTCTNDQTGVVTVTYNPK